MSKTKVEVIFLKKDNGPDGIAPLGAFSVDCDGPMLPNITIPAVGEHVEVDLTGCDFQGQVIAKSTTYSKKDMDDKDWDLVARTILTLELDRPNPKV